MKIKFLIVCYVILSSKVPDIIAYAFNRCPIGKNEIFLVKGPNCDRRCSNLNRDCANYGEPRRTGCFCRSGFARDDYNECVATILCNIDNYRLIY
ncbi:uncharacterized protein LOC142229715 [Haematobia irritans]|uniref:uncharacterized protein LOC142229715 n=1 Tax=Haematobia irritans TaxID=7368 RepID=UPI003F4FA286